MNFSVLKIIISTASKSNLSASWVQKVNFFSPFILSNLQHNMSMQISHGVKEEDMQNILPESSLLGVKVRNMKKDFNIYGTWHRVGQWTLMMKMHAFFIQLSRLVAPYNNMLKIFHLRDDFLHYYTGQLNNLAE